MDKIKMSCLSMELTRRCNFRCEHCFKGDAQNIDLSDNHIDKLLGMIKEIYTLHITGGEPSLNLHGMQHLIDVIIKNDIVIHKLNIISNGATERIEEFFDMVDELNKIAVNPKGTRITVSCDPYHDEIGKISIKNLFSGYRIIQKLNEKGYTFKIYPYFTCCYPPLVSMGRGASNTKFADPENPDEYGILYNRPVNLHGNAIKHICIHATGMIGRDLNISYADADSGEYEICHIDNISSASDLIEHCNQWNKKPDVRLRGMLFDIASRIYSPTCRSCNNFSRVYDKRLKLLKQIINSDEIKQYPEEFTKSDFIINLHAETDNMDTCESVIMRDAMDCEWWNFACWNR